MLETIHLLAFPVLGFLSLWFLIDAYVYDWQKDYLKRMMISFIIFGVNLLFLIYAYDRLDNATWEGMDKPQAVEKIVALNDNNLATGRFYIHRGYIDQGLWYQYIVKVNDGGFVANKVSSKDTTLYYSDDDYRVEWYTRKRHWLWFNEKENYHKIFIPQGSITDDYSVDLK